MKAVWPVRQHLFGAALLYNRLGSAGTPPHAAYLKAFRGASAGHHLVNVMEQGLFGACGARGALG